MIRLRDNRFGDQARTFSFDQGQNVFSAEEIEADGLRKQEIDLDPADLWTILQLYDGKTLPHLRKLSCGRLITLGRVKNESITDPAFFTVGNPEFTTPGQKFPDRFQLETSNLMGILHLRHPQKEAFVRVEILSRFDRDDRQKFLNYLLSRVFQVDFLDLIEAGNDHLWDILVAIMFLQRLKDAIPVGLYKEYRRFEKNDLDFRGHLDLSRHIKENFPLYDKIAYSYHAITYDNPVNHLLRSALETIRKKWPALVYGDPDLRDLSIKLISATLTWNPGGNRELLRMPVCREPLHHPYFSEYYEEPRILAGMILEEEGLSIYNDSEYEVSGVVFDGAWLWEEYISTILTDYIHAEYRIKGGIPVFREQERTFYPDFLRNDRKIVLDTKYKSSKTGMAEDIQQVISYMFLTGAETGGLIFPPGESSGSNDKLTLHCPDPSRYWQNFTFGAIPDNEDFGAFMRKQEQRLKELFQPET